jgi:hypothetical protein
MSRMTRRLVAALVCVCGFGLLAAGSAFSGNGPGTYGSGSWFFDQGNGSNAIEVASTSTSTSTSTAYQAQVQQPINPNGSSVWSANKGVVPVQFTLQQATDTKTTTTTTPAVYPGTLESDNGAACPGVDCYGSLSFTPPTGTTVGNITSLIADFTWLSGNNHTGSMRWSIVTPDGTIYVYYGDLSSTFQSGTGGTGVNMATVTDARVEGSGSLAGTPVYDTWSDVLSRLGGTVANEPVSEIDLVVDAGYAGTQAVQLSDVSITANGSTSEYVPGTVAGSSSSSDSLGPWSNTTAPAMYIDVNRTSGADPGTVDETTYTGVGDTGGQFSVVNGMYKYNLSSSSLGAGTYQVFMDPSSAHTSPIATSPGTFVLK